MSSRKLMVGLFALITRKSLSKKQLFLLHSEIRSFSTSSTKHCMKMSSISREVINVEKAPKAIGPYSHAVRLGRTVYTSGQIGCDPKTLTLVPGGIAAQTKQALTNLQAVLEGSGSNLGSVAKCTVFLADMIDFADMNKVYSEFFPSQPPARSAIQVAKLPLNARVEIEAVAEVNDASNL